MSDYVPVNAILHRDQRGERSIRVSPGGDDQYGAWIGRKWIRDMGPTGSHVHGRNWLGRPVRLPQITISIPKWLAKETRLLR